MSSSLANRLMSVHLEDAEGEALGFPTISTITANRPVKASGPRPSNPWIASPNLKGRTKQASDNSIYTTSPRKNALHRALVRHFEGRTSRDAGFRFILLLVLSLSLLAFVGSVAKIVSAGLPNDGEGFDSLEYNTYAMRHKRDLRAWPAEPQVQQQEDDLYLDTFVVPTGKRRKLRLRRAPPSARSGSA